MPRPKRPSEIHKPDPYPGLTPEQREAMAALSGECLYAATVGGGCRVVKVEGDNPISVAALKGLEAMGLVEVVTLYVYEKREN
jgi:hypothetical protein